ncbi:MAG: DUF1460 domain-containing protein [Dysgonamonadaceae bacterium]|jgi:hypothetical protein|nr:DUF1460 domain-containing protein [Dysgonamonadaceae bacterium]
MKRFISSLLSILFITYASAQLRVFQTDEDKKIFEQYLSYIAPYKDASDETVLEKTALFFLGKPYVAHTLEVTDKEMLIVNLREFDCMTFVETVFALVRTVRADNPTFDTYLDNLRNIRYRNGEITDYSSRLHYIADWIYENEKNGFVKNISSEFSGHRIETKAIHFMSNNQQAYKQLKNDDAMLEKIVKIESNINQRGGFAFIPKEQITNVATQIPNMVVVAFTTSINGLDVTHVGFTFWKNDRLKFIHASTSSNKVIIDERTIAEYCNAQRSCTGVMIVKVY